MPRAAVPAGHVEMRDNDGHRYHIPEARQAVFAQALEKICSAKWQTEALHDANAALDNEFGQYLEG